MKTYAIEIRYGFYISASLFIWMMLQYLLGFQNEYVSYYSIVKTLGLIFPVAFTFVALRKKREEFYDGVISFQQAFKAGIIIAGVCTLLTIPVQLVFHYSINPRFFDVMIEEHVKQAIDKGKSFTEARHQAEAYYNITAYTVQESIGTLVTGALLALIFAWGVKRSESELDALKERMKPSVLNHNES